MPPKSTWFEPKLRDGLLLTPLRQAGSAMKVLIADKFEPSGIDGLKALGCEVSYEPGLKDEALAAAMRVEWRAGAGRALHARSPSRCSTRAICR